MGHPPLLPVVPKRSDLFSTFFPFFFLQVLTRSPEGSSPGSRLSLLAAARLARQQRRNGCFLSPFSCCPQAAVTAAGLNYTVTRALLLHDVRSAQCRGRWSARQREAAGGLKLTAYPGRLGDGSSSGQKLQRGRKVFPSLQEGQCPNPGGKAQTKNCSMLPGQCCFIKTKCFSVGLLPVSSRDIFWWWSLLTSRTEFLKRAR